VLVLTTYYHPILGGVETHARQLVQHLSRRGFGVDVITKRIGANDPRESRVDDIPVHRVGPAGDRRASGKWTAIPSFLAETVVLGRRAGVIVCVDYRGIGVAAVLAGRRLGRPVILQAATAGVLASASANDSSGGNVRFTTTIGAPSRSRSFTAYENEMWFRW